MPRLTDLLRQAGIPAGDIQADPDITHITADSRTVMQGSLFIAIPGTKADGSQFINDATAKGAAAIITSAHTPLPPAGEERGLDAQHLSRSGEGGNDKASPLYPPACGGNYITVENPRLALSKLAAAFYPRQPAHIVAITGTDGKTSTADFTRQLWTLLGYKAASIGTLGTLGGQGELLYPGQNTTPDPVSLHRQLQELHDAGYTHIAMEASSHGLDQYRLDGVRIQAAAFTNLTRDHMDYHTDENDYFRAKARLFSELLPEGGMAVINMDDPRAEEILDICEKRKQDYTVFGHTMEYMTKCWERQRFIIVSITPLPQGQQVKFSTITEFKTILFGFGEKPIDADFEVTLPLVGSFQVFNALAAIGLVQGSSETDVTKIIRLLSQLKGVPGRLELAGTHPSGAPIFVDYAHTPKALENVLKTLRTHTKNRLHVVFGCGGDRDAGKRPEMGKAAAQFADLAVVTDDNPRSEDPEKIRAAIVAECPNALNIGDRKTAIRTAIDRLQAGDCMIIAGKGHETTQTIGKDILPFSDVETVREALKHL